MPIILPCQTTAQAVYYHYSDTPLGDGSGNMRLQIYNEAFQLELQDRWRMARLQDALSSQRCAVLYTPHEHRAIAPPMPSRKIRYAVKDAKEFPPSSDEDL